MVIIGEIRMKNCKKNLGRLCSLELLEERRLLVAYSINDFVSSSCCDAASTFVSSFKDVEDEIDSIMEAVCSCSLKNENNILSGTASRTIDYSGKLTNDEKDLFFKQYGFYLNKDEYVRSVRLDPGNFFTVDRLVSQCQDELNYSVNEIRSGSYVWDLDINVSCCSGLSMIGDTYQLREGYNSVLDFPGSLADPASVDYLTVVLPALPDGYSSTLEFRGSAAYGIDYYAYIPSLYNPISLYDGYVHSGEETTIRFVIIDDRLTEPEPAEDFLFVMNTPTPHEEYDGPLYEFNEICTSVAASIIDNDGWKIGVIAEDESLANRVVISESNNEETNFCVSRIDNGSHHGSDLHYHIDVTIMASGALSSSDYNLYLKKSDGTTSLITPDSAGRFNVRIQENEEFATLTVQAIDDSLVERLEESITFSVVSAVGYPPFLSYQVDPSSYTVVIRDNDKLTLNWISFEENMDLISDTRETFGENWKNRIHWSATAPLQRLPVAYHCDNTLTCVVNFGGNRDLSQTYQVRMKWHNRSGFGSGTITSSWQTLNNLASAEISLDSSFIEIFESRRAYYDLDSRIEWEFRTTSEDTREDDGYIGDSVNPLYITYKAPTSDVDSYYHSLVHLGCMAASDVEVSGNLETESEDELVFQALWNMISSKSINKVKLDNGNVVDDELLTYYGRDVDNDIGLNVSTSDIKRCLSITHNPVSGVFLRDQEPSLARQVALASNNFFGNGYTVDSLLYYKDGTCGAWQDFAFKLSGIQGIVCQKIGVQACNTWGETLAFKVSSGLSGQGGGTPCENTWGDHALIQYGDNVYDPSYGVTYGSRSTCLSNFILNLDSFGCQVADHNNINGYDYGFLYEPFYYWNNGFEGYLEIV